MGAGQANRGGPIGYAAGTIAEFRRRCGAGEAPRAGEQKITFEGNVHRWACVIPSEPSASEATRDRRQAIRSASLSRQSAFSAPVEIPIQAQVLPVRIGQFDQ